MANLASAASVRRRATTSLAPLRWRRSSAMSRSCRVHRGRIPAGQRRDRPSPDRTDLPVYAPVVARGGSRRMLNRRSSPCVTLAADRSGAVKATWGVGP